MTRRSRQENSSRAFQTGKYVWVETASKSGVRDVAGWLMCDSHTTLTAGPAAGTTGGTAARSTCYYHLLLIVFYRPAGHCCRPASVLAALGGGCSKLLPEPASDDNQAVSDVTGRQAARGASCFSCPAGYRWL
jgi:hypothetical protein